MTKKYLAIAAILGVLTACADKDTATDTKAKAPKMDHSKIVTGNGTENYITLEGSTRSNAAFTFPNVTINKAGFLVMHPFRDGKPVQTEYVGAVPVRTGTNSNVAIAVDPAPQTGDMYIVMLHYDINEDGVFDFGDGVTVPDAPVFEGHTLVALRYETPENSAP